MEKETIEEYESLKQKYNLPAIEELAKDFDIEKLDEENYFFLLKTIRKIINEKISSYLQLFENMINPSSSPIFLYSILRDLNSAEKQNIKKIYESLAKIQLKTLKLDCTYDEESEAEFIRTAFQKWQTLKKEIQDISSKIYSAERNSKNPKPGDYFF